MFILFVSLLTLASLTSLALSADTINLKNYLHEALPESLSLQEASVQHKQSETLKLVAEDLYKTEWSMGPYYNHSDSNYFQNNGSWLSSQGAWSGGLASNLSQTFPKGTTVALGLNHSAVQYPLTSASQPNWDYNISITQSLGQNIFGRINTKNLQEKKHAFISQGYLWEQEYLTTCSTLIKKYIQSFLAQQKLETRQAILNRSEKVYKLSQTLYKKRLIKKIELLGAHTDFLNNKAVIVDEKKRVDQLINDLFQHRKQVSKNIQLENPNDFMKKIDQATPKDWLEKQNLQWLAAHQNWQTKKEAMEIAQISQQPDLNIVLTAGRQSGNSLLSSVPVELESNYSKVQLNLSWPLGSKSRSAQYELAQKNYSFAKFQFKKTTESLRLTYLNLIREKNDLDQLVQISQKKIELNTQQIKEALRLYQSGRMEFSNYGSYRDQHSIELIKVYDLQLSQWNNIAELYSMSQDKDRNCTGAASE